jgi:hypothetical protein
MAVIPSPRRYSLAQIALGLFITWQLLFLGLSNLLAFFPHETEAEGELSDSRHSMPVGNSGPIQEVINVAGQVADRWGFLTGQVQAWWLFAPSFPTQATFPAVEFRWQGAIGPTTTSPTSVRLLSSFEPLDPHTYFKWPGSRDRLFHYEARLGLIMLYWDKEIPLRYPEEWRAAMLERVRRQWKSIRAYLRWRLQDFQQKNPDLPSPTEAILHIRVFRSPVPGQNPVDWDGPYDLPLARWKPGQTSTRDKMPIEAWDPIAKQFVPLHESRTRDE